jgi:hypothetical protein
MQCSILILHKKVFFYAYLFLSCIKQTFMKLAQFATQMASKGVFIKASFGGFAGSGKTRTASELLAGAYKDLKLTKPILIIDNEKGSRFLIPFFKKEIPNVEVYVKDTTKVADVIQAMELLQAGEIGSLFIDSLSKVWYQYVRDYREKNRITFMQLNDWGKILPAWQEEFSDKFVSIDGTIVFTGRGGFSYEKEEDERDEQTGRVKKGQFVKSGVKMKMAGETPFEPDLNVWMELNQEMGPDGLKVWREAQVLKDRSSLIDGKTFTNPSYKDFQPFVQFLNGLPTGAVAGPTHTENNAPGDDPAKWERKRQREIVFERIQGLFDKYQYSGSMSKEAKQVKALINERIFGTLSATELEKMPLEKLLSCEGELAELLKELAPIEDKAKHIKSWKQEEKLPF